MGLLRICLVVLALMFGSAGPAQAQTDLSVDFTAQPSSSLVPGQPIEFTVTVTNHGPEPVPAVGSNLALFSSDFYDQFDSSFGSADCQGYTVFVSDGDAFHFNLVWFPTFQDQGALEVGESRSCHITLALSNQAPAEWPFSFGVAESFDDINPDNNVSTVILRRGDMAPIAVPTLSTYALLLLIVALALLANTTFARTSNSRIS